MENKQYRNSERWPIIRKTKTCSTAKFLNLRIPEARPRLIMQMSRHIMLNTYVFDIIFRTRATSKVPQLHRRAACCHQHIKSSTVWIHTSTQYVLTIVFSFLRTSDVVVVIVYFISGYSTWNRSLTCSDSAQWTSSSLYLPTTLHICPDPYCAMGCVEISKAEKACRLFGL